MPTPTYTLIDSVTLGANAANVTFSGIPAAGKGDLILTMVLQSNTGVNVFVKPNGDATSANYSYVIMGGLNGSSSGFSGNNSGSYSGLFLTAYAGVNSTDRWQATMQLMDYSATNKQKSTLTRVDSIPQATSAIAGRWASTAAVTSLEISTGTANTFSAGSTFHLYQLVSE